MQDHNENPRDSERKRDQLFKIIERLPEMIRRNEAAQTRFKHSTDVIETDFIEIGNKIATILSSEKLGQIDYAAASQLITKHIVASQIKTLALKEKFNQRSIEVERFDEEMAAIRSVVKRLEEMEN